jgi:hypothetical protein
MLFCCNIGGTINTTKVRKASFIRSNLRNTFLSLLHIMTSVSTIIPAGIISEWCITQPYFLGIPGTDYQCANSSRGTVESDFITICCDGDIIDTAFDLYFHSGPTSLDINDLVCCQPNGPQTGGLQPIAQGPYTYCTSGTPIPLISFAATNTGNQEPFLVTYTSASYGDHTTGDFIPTQVPQCLWADTAHGISLTTAILPAPMFTTLSSSGDGAYTTINSVYSSNTAVSQATTSSYHSSSSSASNVKSSSTTASSSSGVKFTMRSGLAFLVALTITSLLI